MNIEEYSVKALRTVNCLGTYEADLAHMAMGISGEAGEVTDIIKKTFAYNKELDKSHLVEEIGDILFYMNGLLALLDVPWSSVMQTNIAKLEARYAGSLFSLDQALNRDKLREASAMENILKVIP
jgi:NTP pyrophosphatase (non-canonical NTP hydrolase)